MNSIAFIYGNTVIYWSSIVMTLSVATGIIFFLASWMRRKENVTAAALACPLAIILSMIFGRLLHWYFLTDSYNGFLSAMTDYTSTGYALSGAFAGCLLTAYILKGLGISKNTPFLLDCMSIGGSAALSLGRLACLFNTENRGAILAGFTDLPFVWPVVNPTSGVLEYRFATFCFQSIIAGLIFLYLFISAKKRHKDGDITLRFILLYCASQVVLDSTRYDALRLRSNGFISVVQVLCAFGLVIALAIISIRLIKKNGLKVPCIFSWLICAASMTGAGYMEYHVQRHGDQAIIAYSIMSICLLITVTVGMFLLKRTNQSEQEFATSKNRTEKQIKKGTAATAVILSTTITTVLLLGIFLYSGTPRQKKSISTNMGVVEKFYMNASNAVSDAASGIMDIEKKYWISADAKAAPKPDKNGYGRTNDPTALSETIQSAEKLLDGQELHFSEDITLVEGTDIRYYLDETILVITWKQPIDNTVYTFSEVKIADPSQFRRFLAGGEYGSGKLAVPTEMANSVNSVVASSGDYYQFRNAGVIVYEGEVCRVNGGADTCYIDRSGNLYFTRVRDTMNREKAEAFVKENDIQFSVAFGPILVENGEKQSFTGYGLGEIADQFARAALCQLGDLHYLLVNANGEQGHSSYPTMYQFSQRIFETGAENAYALDGGQTAVVVMDGELINQVTRGFQRKISDIIYFATAVSSSE